MKTSTFTARIGNRIHVVTAQYVAASYGILERGVVETAAGERYAVIRFQANTDLGRRNPQIELHTIGKDGSETFLKYTASM